MHESAAGFPASPLLEHMDTFLYTSAYGYIASSPFGLITAFSCVGNREIIQLVAKVLAQNSDFVRKWSASVKWHGRSLLSCTGSFCMRSRLSPIGAVSISVALCCLAAEKSRGLARETAEAFLLLFKGVNAENCQQAQVPFLYCLGAVAYRPGVKQAQGLYQFNGRAGGGRQGMREVGASARLS